MRKKNGEILIAWRLELEEFSEFCSQLIFDAARAIVLFGMFWVVSRALHFVMANQASEEGFAVAVLHGIHTIFGVFASLLTLAYTLMRIAIGPIHEVYQTLSRIRWERGSVQEKQFLDIELELQAALMRESKILRFQGFRMNEALKRPEFFDALGVLDEIKLIFMAPFDDATDHMQRTHNAKFYLISPLPQPPVAGFETRPAQAEPT